MIMKKKTIAFFARNIHDSVGECIWKGILQKASDLDINILTFRGDILGVDTGSIIYQLVSDRVIDGIISWASSEDDGSLKFFDRYSNIPLITITIKLPGIPAIFADNYSGMKVLIEHLIHKHGKKKIAFIRGPESHVYAKERYNAYKDTIKKHGFVDNEQLVTPPRGWSQECGIASMKTLFEERHLKPGADVDAIVCVNDLTAIGVCGYLNENGFIVPSDIAVTGYNNSTQALSITPPVTTVALPFEEMGELSVDLVEKKLRDHKVAEKHLLPAHLVLGESCGCQSLSIVRAGRKG